MMTDWIKTSEQSPPKDKPFWAYLYHCGIQILYDAGGGHFVDVLNEGETYSPMFWLPLDALPAPPDFEYLPDSVLGCFPESEPEAA